MELMSCPYNVSHQIRPERMQYHLLKCKKQYPEVNLRICPFNAIHHIRMSDWSEHLMNCPDRRIVDIQRFRLNSAQPGRHGNLATPLVFGSSLIRPEPSENRYAVGTSSETRQSRMDTIAGRATTRQHQTSLQGPSNQATLQANSEEESNWSTAGVGFETCNTSQTSATNPLGDEVKSRTRSPSPASSVRSIPRLHRYGRTPPRPNPVTVSAGKAYPRPDPVIVPESRKTLRRPRTLFDAKEETMKSSTKSNI